MTKLNDIAVGVIFPIGNRYWVIERLRAYHSQYIQNLSFYGFQGFDTAPNELIHYEDDQGYLIYNVMVDMIQRYPNADGWMMLHDDFWINWPLMQESADFSKILTITNTPISYAQEFTDVNKGGKWHWWPTQWGKEAVAKAFKECDNKWGKQNYPNIDIPIRVAASDFLYVPKQHGELFLHNFKVMAKHKVFHEIATPTVCGISAPNADVVNLKGHWILSCEHVDYRSVDYPSCYGVHQVKLHDETQFAFMTSRQLI